MAWVMQLGRFSENAFGVVYVAGAKWIQLSAVDPSGKALTTDRLERLRPDERIESLETLVAQMEVDKARARSVLSHEEPSLR